MASASSKPKLSSLFTHYSPTIPSSNHPKCPPQPLASPEIPPENFNRGFSFKHRLHTFLHNCKTGKLEAASELFEKLSQEGLQPDVVTYNIMIHGFCKKRQVDKASILFQKMEANGCTPNTITYNTLLRGFCKSNKSEEVVQLLHRMVQKDVSPDACTCTIGVDMLCKDEKYQEFLDLLPRFPVQERRH